MFDIIKLFVAILLVCLFIVNLYIIKRIRNKKENNAYKPIITACKQLISAPDAVIATTYPQLLTCELDKRCIGATQLTECLPGIIRNHSPDYIILENIRAKNYYEYFKGKAPYTKGYEIILHDKKNQFLILLRINS